MAGDTYDSIIKSPILAKYKRSGYEVLIMDDPIDEFTTQHLSEYEKRKVKSIAKDDVSILDGNDETAKKKLQKLKEMYKPLTDWLKEYLGKNVEKVNVSNKLDEAPLYIFTSQYGYSARMEKINKAQAFANQEKAPGYMLAKKVLEINPNHGVMKVLLEQVKDGVENISAETKEYVDLLFQMALVNSGFSIDEPQQLTDPLERLIRVGFGVDRDAPIVEIEIEIEDDEEVTEEGDAEPLEDSTTTDATETTVTSDTTETVEPTETTETTDQLTVEEVEEVDKTLTEEL